MLTTGITHLFKCLYLYILQDIQWNNILYVISQTGLILLCICIVWLCRHSTLGQCPLRLRQNDNIMSYPLDKMAWMKSFVFWVEILWILSLRVQMTINQHVDNGFAPNRRQAIIWTNVDAIHWRISAATLGGLCQSIVLVMKYLFTVSNLYQHKPDTNM